MCISLATRSTSAMSEILSFSRILTATYIQIEFKSIHTFSPVKMCFPSFTLPKVPSPTDVPMS